MLFANYWYLIDWWFYFIHLKKKKNPLWNPANGPGCRTPLLTSSDGIGSLLSVCGYCRVVSFPSHSGGFRYHCTTIVTLVGRCTLLVGKYLKSRCSFGQRPTAVYCVDWRYRSIKIIYRWFETLICTFSISRTVQTVLLWTQKYLTYINVDFIGSISINNTISYMLVL